MQNEDRVLVDRRFGLVILADGMGGQKAGEVASGMATTVLARELTQALGQRPLRSRSPDSWASNLLRKKIAVTNAAIFGAARSQPQYSGMGTTLVVGLFYADHVAVAHAGDSRLYRLRAGQLTRMTKDHSFAQLQLDAGLIVADEASERTSMITRALGIEAHVDPEIQVHDVKRGDVYLFCSDGLSDMVSDSEIATILESRGPLQSITEQLVHAANEHGGRDNISVVLVRVQGVPAPQRRWRRFFPPRR